jgi:hypothetical protein
MTARADIIRFPPRRSAAILVHEVAEGGWIVLAQYHGWTHGDARSAFADAQWLSRNLGLPIREVRA